MWGAGEPHRCGAEPEQLAPGAGDGARTGPSVRTTIVHGGRTLRSTGTSASAGSSPAAMNHRKTDSPREVNASGRSAVSARGGSRQVPGSSRDHQTRPVAASEFPVRGPR